MTAFGFPTENWARVGVASASAESPGLGAGQVQTDRGSTADAWQTPAGTTSAWLQFDAGAAVAWRAFALFRTNLTGAATMRWRVGNDPTFATSVDDSGVIAAGVQPGYGQAVRLLAAPVTGRYCRVDLADTGNPEGLLRVALAYAGPLRVPLRRFGLASAFQRSPAVNEVRTRGGQVFPDFRYALRGWSIVLPTVALTEQWTLVQELQRVSEAGANVLFVPFLAGTDAARDVLFGRLVAPSPMTFPAGASRLRAWSCTIEERL